MIPALDPDPESDFLLFCDSGLDPIEELLLWTWIWSQIFSHLAILIQ